MSQWRNDLRFVLYSTLAWGTILSIIVFADGAHHLAARIAGIALIAGITARILRKEN